ncbi:g4362 [Coccomyxa viridis]|uniref:alanine--glyoxylate transaminase n=1 Tax=Coccomyxa viridis TaxID=1274662 RepID=A0ABP1FX09_9CHLO
MAPSLQELARPDESTPQITQSALENTPIKVPQRYLMGPGPGNAHPRVLAAQSLPLLGHMHPAFFAIMDEIQDGLRYMFQTKSKYVCLISGTGHSGMEAAIANMLEPGETIVVGNNGIWGQRVCEIAERYGGKVINAEVPAGAALSLRKIEDELERNKPAVLFLCQGESSTGAHQALGGVAEACRKHDTILVVDTVCSLGAVPFYGDAWGVDCMYSGSQKVLGAPPGAAPFMLGERGFKKLKNRKTKVASWYFDLNMILDYWGCFGPKRFYHHTGMVSNWYGIREALGIASEEGLESMWERHRRLHLRLWEGLNELGLEPFVEKEQYRLVSVNTIKVPEGVDCLVLCKNAMDKYSVEIAGGLGPSAGKVWRVGIMGYNAQLTNVELVLTAFKDGLAQQGFTKRHQVASKDVPSPYEGAFPENIKS